MQDTEFLTIDTTPLPLPSKFPFKSLFGTSVKYTGSVVVDRKNPELLILYPFELIWNLLPKHSSYWANWFRSAFKFLLILILVIFDVIPVSTLSITCNILLYLNLPPNVFRSTDEA